MTAFKTLSMRIRGAESELEEAGLDAEGMAESTAKLREEILALSGVDIMLDDETFKSTYQILKELSEVWGNLSDINQANITELIAGKRQGNIISSLMNNFDIAEKALKTSQESAGSAMSEHGKWMESLEAKLQKLQATWQSLSQSFMDSNFLGGLIDGLTNVVNLLDGVVSTVGTLPTLLAGISGFMSMRGKGLFNYDGNSFKLMNVDLSNLIGNYEQVTVAINRYNSLSTKSASFQQAYNNALSNSNSAIGKYLAGLNGSKATMSGYIKSLVSAKASTIAMKAATVALNMALTMGLAWGISKVCEGLSYLINYYKNASEAADELKNKSKENADAAQEEVSKLNELIAKYKELAQSDTQDISVRTEIKNVQGQIVDLVGQQAGNLDLVNGKLDDELEKLLKIQKIKAEKAVETSSTAYHNAKDSSDKAVGDSKGSWLHPGLGTYDYIGSRDKDAEKILKDAGYGGYLSTGGWFNNTLYLTAIGDNAEEKAEFLQGMIDELKSASDEYDYASSDFYHTLVSQKESYEGYTNDVNEAASTLVDSITTVATYDSELANMNVNSVESFEEYRNKLISIIKNSPDLKEALASGDITENDISKQVNDYLSTLSNFSDYYNEWYKSIENSSDIEERLSLSLDDLLGEDNDFDKSIDTYIEKVGKLKEALSDFQNGTLSESEFSKLVKEFPELADEADNLDVAIVNLLDDMNTDMVNGFGEQFGNVETEEDIEALQSFQNAVLELGSVVGDTNFSIDIEAEAKGMENLFDAMKESVSSTGLTSESIKNLKERYQDLESYDASRLFEKTANGVHLNTKALRELESEYEKQTKTNIDNKLSYLTAQYNSLTEEINNCSDASKTAELYVQRENILNQINETSLLAAQYEGLTSAFYKWEQAQSIGEEGDMYDNLSGSLKDIKKLYDDGLIGTNKFRTAVQLMSNEDLSTASIDELISAYDAGYSKMTRYFTDSSDGCLNFLNDLQKVNSEWVSMNDDGSWNIDFGVGNDQEIADALGINVESVQAIMRKLSDYGFDINLDSAYSSLDTLKSEAEKANDKLKELGATDYTFNFNTDDVEYLNEQIDEAKNTIQNLKNEDGTLKVGVSEADYKNATNILSALIYQKQKLDKSAILSVDTTNANSEIETTISKLQEFKSYSNTLEVEAAVGADTTEAQTNIQTVLKDIENIPDDVKTNLGLDDSEFQTALTNLLNTKVDVKAGVNLSEDELAIINSRISSITPEMMVKCGLDDTLIANYQADEHTTDGEVIWDNNIDKVTAWINKKHKADGVVDWGNNTTYVKKTFTAVGTVKWTNGVRVDGTAHAMGTAFARGSWGTKESGVALGGELGQELVVRNGRFFTIGDKSAEFFKYQKGDIIFNAEQTKEIFEKGKITHGNGRGKALASGTAFIEGTAFSSGTGKITAKGKVKTTPSNSSKSNSKSKSKSSTKDFKEVFDWIEIAIDRIERVISKLDAKAKNAFKSWSSRNENLSKEISKVGEEIDLQEKAYNKYIEKANSVGLDKKWKKKVQDGTIDISTIKNESLAEKIKEYQEWYEKALDCQDAIDDLKEKESELYKQRFDNVIAEYDGYLGVIEFEKNMLEESIAQSEAKGYITSTKYYEALIASENDNISKLQSEKASLLSSLQEGMESGAIEKGSEEWYAMCAEIDSVTLAIKEGETAVLEYVNAIRDIEWEVFDLLQEKISQITNESNFLIDLLSNDKLYTDNGQLTDEGMATMGLHGQNYNVYMAQADKYAQEILNIDKELANDPYNQDLIKHRQELLELQQESILSAEDEKQAMIDMVREGIELELSALQDLIDSYNEALDSQKDLYDYQKKVAEQTKEIANLEKQMSAYEGDNSEEARAKIQKIKVSLEEAKQNLQETEYDKYISDQKQLLDELYINYETILNERLDNIDLLVSDMILEINNSANTISNTLSEKAESVGYTLSESMTSIWDTKTGETNTILTTYGDKFNESITNVNTVLNNINIGIQNMIAALNKDAEEDVKETEEAPASKQPEANVSHKEEPKEEPKNEEPEKPKEKDKSNKKTIKKGGKIKATGAKIYEYKGDKSGSRQYYRKDPIYKVLAVDGSWIKARYHKLKSGVTGWFKKKDVKAYKTGKKNILNNEMAWTQENGQEYIIRPSDGAILTPIAQGDSVLNAKATNNIWNMSNNPSEFIRENLGVNTSSMPNKLGSQNTYNQNLDKVIFNLPNVKNYDELIYAMQHDKNFEKLLLSMTIDRVAGKSSLAKNKAIRK